MVEYQKGCENKVADALSMRSDSAFEGSVNPTPSDFDSALFFISFPCPTWIEELKDSYHHTLELQ